jgi:hypothetical protein
MRDGRVSTKSEIGFGACHLQSGGKANHKKVSNFMERLGEEGEHS